MSNLIELPNGAVWDNEKTFQEQVQEAQYWVFETLKMIADAIAEGKVKELSDQVARYSVVNPNLPKEQICYAHLERDGIHIHADKQYLHKDWPKVFKGKKIPDADWYKVDSWVYEEQIQFKLSN